MNISYIFRKQRKNAAKNPSAVTKLILFLAARHNILYLIKRGVRDCNSELRYVVNNLITALLLPSYPSHPHPLPAVVRYSTPVFSQLTPPMTCYLYRTN